MEDNRKETGSRGLTRRQFVQATTAVAASGAVLDFATAAEKALAYEGDANYTITTTTCPYCSAQCGQRVVKRNSDGAIVDLYGDFESPINNGGLCAKGAGSLQLVNNPRRVGAFTFPMTYHGNALASHPTHSAFGASGTAATAYKRVEGTQDWTAMPLATALDEIAVSLKGYRGNFTAGEASGYNSQSVAFFGCSHMNNEENYLYRRLIAQFGTTNTEHQARI